MNVVSVDVPAVRGGVVAAELIDVAILDDGDSRVETGAWDVGWAARRRSALIPLTFR